MRFFKTAMATLATALGLSGPALAEPVTSGDDLTMDHVKCMFVEMSAVVPSIHDWEQPVFLSAPAFNGYHFQVNQDVEIDGNNVGLGITLWFTQAGELKNDVIITNNNGWFASSGTIEEALTADGELIVRGAGGYPQAAADEVRRVYHGMDGAVARCIG